MSCAYLLAPLSVSCEVVQLPAAVARPTLSNVVVNLANEAMFINLHLFENTRL